MVQGRIQSTLPIHSQCLFNHNQFNDFRASSHGYFSNRSSRSKPFLRVHFDSRESARIVEAIFIKQCFRIQTEKPSKSPIYPQQSPPGTPRWAKRRITPLFECICLKRIGGWRISRPTMWTCRHWTATPTRSGCWNILLEVVFNSTFHRLAGRRRVVRFFAYSIRI
jgi:hypothetical protein